MKPIPITETEGLSPAMIFGKPALFTILRIDRATIPEGLYCYDIRHSDEDFMDPATVEKFVLVNHMGTIITKEPIEIDESGFRVISETDDDFYLTDYDVVNTADVNNITKFLEEVYDIMKGVNYYVKIVKAIQLTPENYVNAFEFSGNLLINCVNLPDASMDYGLKIGDTTIPASIGDYLVKDGDDFKIVSKDKFITEYKTDI